MTVLILDKKTLDTYVISGVKRVNHFTDNVFSITRYEGSEIMTTDYDGERYEIIKII